MNLRHLILGIIKENGGSINGRTLLQKQVYFASLILGENVDFTPYYYGPYSWDASNSLAELVDGRFVDEAVTHWEGGYGYEYIITRRGEKFLATAHEEDSCTYDSLAGLIKVLKRRRFANNTKMLSAAAKVHYIIHSRHGEPIQTDEIKDEAENLGWRLTSRQIDRVSELLEELELIEIGN